MRPFLSPTLRLMRLDRPIGAWLLLLPCWWSVALASGGMPNLGLMLLFALGSVVMRGAGCVVNDIIDRDIDRQVERTKDRPLARGDIKVWQAWILFALLSLSGLAVLLTLNRLTVGLGVASMALVLAYPFAKRVTWWPQLVLGLAFNWGALMGWSAVRNDLSPPALWLYAAGIFWTLGYDTLYAHQDKRDDAKIGVKSLALRLGPHARLGVALFYVAAGFCLALAGRSETLSPAFYVGLFLAALHAAWHVMRWRTNDPADSAYRFRANRDFGLLILGALIMGKML